MSFIKELKRRNVFRMAVVYVIAAWVIMQVAEVLKELANLPDWAGPTILGLLAVGFPIALILSWFYELTPEGISLEKHVDRAESITHINGRRLDFIVISLLCAAVILFAYDKWWIGRPPQESIAVLPFVNMSNDATNEYFSDGISEELLNLLTKIPELKVASRTSAFQFKGEKIDLAEVAQKLKVAHVLEGSVRSSGNQVRITAQLIKADDGYHMWSQTYDRSMDNIFAIQDEISVAVVEALKIKLLGEAPRSEVVNPEAYALFLKGRYLYAQWGKDNLELAIDSLKAALVIEPAYTEAWSLLSAAYLAQTQNGNRKTDEGVALARGAIDQALAIDPDRPSVLARLAYIQLQFDWEWTSAEATIQKMLRIAPQDTIVLGTAGFVAGSLGRGEESLAFHHRVLAQDPLDLATLYNSADVLHRLGRLEEAISAYRQLLELNPADWGSHTQIAIILLRQDKPQDAWRELELEVDPQQQEFGRILALPSLGRDAEATQRLDVFIEQNQSWASFLIANIYAWQGDNDSAFTWLEQAYQERAGSMALVLLNPMLTGLHDDPRWGDLLDRMGLPH